MVLLKCLARVVDLVVNCSLPMEESYMTDLNQSSKGSEPPGQTEAKLVYQELCPSYRSIETFRGQLLGLLPLFSGSGIVLLLKSPFTEIMKGVSAGQYIGWVGILGCIVTLGLFSYE